MLNLKFKLTSEEYYEYNYFTAWSSPDRKRYRLQYYLKVFSLYIFITGIYIFNKREDNLIINLSVFFAIGIVYFLLVPALIRRSVRRRVNDILRKPENQHVLEEAEVILMDTGIIDKDIASESKYTWDAVVKKSETGSSYYLYTNSYHAIVIPKRAIISRQDQEELQRLFNQHLPLSSEFS